ncbi:MAG: hypothetical protein KC996_01635 [Phycisphaerales bacterium]|nr:hypothetical protein [Phycisphaerales bacterium]
MRRGAGSLLAGVVLGVVASVADAGISQFFVSASAFHRANILTVGDGFNYQEDDSFFRELTAETGYVSVWDSPLSAAVSHNEQSAGSRSTNVLNTDASGIELTSTVRIDSSLGDGARSLSFASFYFDSGIVFDRDTEVDVFMRIDFERSSSYYRYGSVEIDGLEGAQTERLAVSGDGASGHIETGYRAMALAGDFIRLRAQIEGEADTDFGGVFQDSGEFTITAVVRVVPAPGGAGLLAMTGILAVRRRRESRR